MSQKKPKHSFKAPAFQLYAKEFLQDEAVIAMELDAVGAYILLLCHEWNEGSIPADAALQARICRTTAERMQVIWPQIAVKFPRSKHDPTRLMNPKLETVRKEKKLFSAKQAKSGELGAQKRWNRKPINDNRIDGVAHLSAMATSMASALANDSSGSGSGFGFENTTPTPADRGEGAHLREVDLSGHSAEQRSELEVALDRVAAAIHARHPGIRRDCRAAAVRKKLEAILKYKRTPAAGRVQYLESINETHMRTCATEQWTKGGGEYAKGLDNWLAPTKERYDMPAPNSRDSVKPAPKVFTGVVKPWNVVEVVEEIREKHEAEDALHKADWAAHEAERIARRTV